MCLAQVVRYLILNLDLVNAQIPILHNKMELVRLALHLQYGTRPTNPATIAQQGQTLISTQTNASLALQPFQCQQVSHAWVVQMALFIITFQNNAKYAQEA